MSEPQTSTVASSSPEKKVTKTGLPEPWTIRYSRSKKREYFFDPTTKKSQWDKPEGTNDTELSQYLKENPIRVHCLHILIKHKDSRRPASHRENNITLSKEDAIKELTQLKERIQTDAKSNEKDSFEKIAYERSDCSSYKRNGDLGWFGRGEMQESFEKVAFQLPVGEISDIVETQSGVHIIKRVA